MATEKVTHGVLVVASEGIGQAAEKAFIAAGAFRAKAVTGARPALAAIGTVSPYFLVFEAGLLPVPAIQAVKNMAELAASRPVPVIMICGPVDATIEKLRASLGIAQVLNSPFDSQAVVAAIQGMIDKAEFARKEAQAKAELTRKDSQLRKQKQMQIQERLRTASNKYASMSEAAARERLTQPPEQDFASDDVAPPAPVDPKKPPPDPTWDGSSKG